MRKLQELWQKDTLRVIGLMSGTSADGMDAALTEITGHGPATRVKTLGFVSLSYTDRVRNEILRLAAGKAGGSHDLCLFSFLLGQLSLDACRA
ncbi:MAG: anhydro-N-acetylmuramic acid kinase, partial [Clostridia bacterium]|nr:anhydro-N-acetylmuramic acid kinase [Clostridia bacterium]